jgi:hypothetical protein
MCKEIRHHVLTGELWGKGKTWPDLSTGMYLLMIQSRLYQLAMLAVSAIDTQCVSVLLPAQQFILSPCRQFVFHW